MPPKQPEKSPLPRHPNLSDLLKAPHEVPPSGCHKKWIKETDSSYVRLAKQGGQPDLLKHYTPVVTKSPSAPYAAPDWYLHHTSPPAMDEPRSSASSLPEYMIHREFKADDHRGNSYEARRGPFDFDTKSVWQRDAEDKENAEKKKCAQAARGNKTGLFSYTAYREMDQDERLQWMKLPAINPEYPSRMLNISTTKEFSGANKLSFPPVPAQRKIEAVNFSKLISNGYGTDWFQQYPRWEKKIQDPSENSEQSRDSEPSQSEPPPASKS